MFVKQWIAEQTDKPAVEHNAVDELSTPRKNQKLGLGIALGITVLALSVGVFFLVQSVRARRSKERTLNGRPGGETEKSRPREMSSRRD
jgi:hypothetical protein